MRKVALPTLHGKGAQIIPALQALGEYEVIEVAIDTDSFGTFSGEKERELTPLDAAIAKARLAMEVTGFDSAIASEGSIGNDPQIPFIISDREVVVFVDQREDLIIHESYRSFEIVAARMEFKVGDDLDDFLTRADFPNHKLIVTARQDDGLFVAKGIESRESLDQSLNEALSKSKDGIAIIESDLRAHCSPSRQVNIEKAARLLAERMAQRCPQCDCIGWGRIDFEFGVECRECGQIDERVAKREINGCLRCSHRACGKVLREMIDAGECQRCNP